MNSQIEHLLERLQSLLPEGSKACIKSSTAQKLNVDIAPTSEAASEKTAGDSSDSQLHNDDSCEWTTSDDWLLRLAWGTVSIDSIASMLGRQISQIQARIEDYRSRLLTGSWQPEELRLLAKFYASRANVDLEITLLRPQTQIATTAKCMGLKKQRSPAADRNASLNLRDINQNNRSQQGKSTRRKRSTRDAKMPRWTEDEVQRLIEVYGNIDNQAISRELGRSITSIANKAWQLGISKSIEQLAKVGRSNVNRRHSKTNDTTLASKTSEKETKPSQES